MIHHPWCCRRPAQVFCGSSLATILYTLLFTLLITFIGLGMSPDAHSKDGWSAFRAAHVWTGDDIVSPGTIVVHNGKIVTVLAGSIDDIDAAVGKLPAARGGDVSCTIYDMGDATITPGLVDLMTSLGTEGQASESARPMTPNLRAIDAVDLSHRHFAESARAGVTLVGVTPSAQNIIGGRVGLVKTSDGRGSAKAMRANGPMHLSLSSDAFQQDRPPTSYAGSMTMIRGELAAAEGNPDHPLSGWLGGSEWTWVVAPNSRELETALSWMNGIFHKKKLRCAAIGVDAQSVFKLEAALGAAKLPVVLNPISMTSPERALHAPMELAKAGVPFAFASSAPDHHPDALRESAALAVAFGLDSKTAMASLTTIPASLLGVGDRVGRIRAGFEADLTVFSGNPLSLQSSCVMVVVDGLVVHWDRAEEPWVADSSDEVGP